MSGKNQVVLPFNWQSANPQTTLFPLNPQTQSQGSQPSGTLSGSMSGTNTIYSNIVDISRMDDLFIDVIWTVLLSGSGHVFSTVPANAFTPTLVSPSGAPAKLGLNMALLGAKYVMLQYTNVSGSGLITSYMQIKDLN